MKKKNSFQFSFRNFRNIYSLFGHRRRVMSDALSLHETGVGLDLCEKEQSELARQYVLTSELDTNEQWSHAGPNSISPFAPCASSRIPHILNAARLDETSVLWDLGCGDGRVLHEAASRHDCRCVGVEIDKPCVVEAERLADGLGTQVKNKCSWHLKDVTQLPPGSLGTDDAIETDIPSPTVILLFITGHGLCALSGWLKHEWETAAKPFAVITCVEALDTCVDLISISGDNDDGGNPLFDQTINPHDWSVYRDCTHAKYGVFVTPPRGVTVEEWEMSKAVLKPVDPQSVTQYSPQVLKNVLDENDVSSIEQLVQRLHPGFFDDISSASEILDTCKSNNSNIDDETLAMRLGAALLDDDASDEKNKKTNVWSAAEDACHSHRSHRVVHLHAYDSLDKYAPTVRAKLLRAAFEADTPWGLTKGRSLFIRSAEYHAYESGGGVVDTNHRDTGSVLTVSVLLEKPMLYGKDTDAPSSGGVFFTRDERDGGEVVDDPTNESGESIHVHENLNRGDCIVFPSEKRHGVTALVGDNAVRKSAVLELWEGGVTLRNRQE